MNTSQASRHLGRRRLRLAACCTAVLLAAGCAPSHPALVAGLPGDLANAPAPDDAPLRRALVASYDGFYAGAVAPRDGTPPCGSAAGPDARTMLVVDGAASFGVNLPFRGTVAADGSLDMPYLDLGRVTGRFGDGAFLGELRAGPGLRCRWTVRLMRTALPSPADPAPAMLRLDASVREPWHFRLASRPSLGQPAPGSLLHLVSMGGTAPSAPPGSETPCTAAVNMAEQRHATAPGLLAAIARVESGRPVRPGGAVQPWPWTVNADGQGLFFPSKADAVAWVRGALARKTARFLDVGCMQVDLQMHPAAFASLEEAFDPAVNADYAARYLLKLRSKAGGDWSAAAGLYRSSAPALAASYRARLAMAGAGTASGVDWPGAGMAPEGRLGLALANGGTLLVNLHRQPTAPGYRRPDACQVAAALQGEVAAHILRGCGRRG